MPLYESDHAKPDRRWNPQKQLVLTSIAALLFSLTGCTTNNYSTKTDPLQNTTHTSVPGTDYKTPQDLAEAVAQKGTYDGRQKPGDKIAEKEKTQKTLNGLFQWTRIILP